MSSRAESISRRAQERRDSGWTMPRQQSQLLPDGRKKITCGDCGRVWEARTSERRVFCKECRRERRQDQGIASFFRAIGNEDPELFERLWATQDGKCAICTSGHSRASRSSYRLSIDHCHETGHVRGLLCEPCNLGIGQFGDDLELVEKAYAYVVSDGDLYRPETGSALVKAALDIRYWNACNDETRIEICVTCWTMIDRDSDPSPRKNRKYCGRDECAGEQHKKMKEIWSLRKKYDVSYEDVLYLWTQRAVGCAICGKKRTSSKRGLALDHNHRTNRPRGYLCDRCNYGIGQLQDDVHVLERAVDYLDEFQRHLEITTRKAA